MRGLLGGVALVAMYVVLPLAAQESQETVTVLGKTATEWATILREDRSPRKRQGAVVALGVIGTRSAKTIPTLLDALRDDPEAVVRRRIIDTLGQLPQEDPSETIRSLARTLTKDKQDALRAAAGTALGRFGARSALVLEELEQALADAHPPTRAAAADTIGRFGIEGSPAIPELIPLLEDSDKGVRLSAAFALGRVGPEGAQAAGQLAKLLTEDPDAEIRRTAAKSLGLLGAKAATGVGALAKALENDSNPVVRRAAVVGLTRMKTAASAVGPTLVKALQEDDDKSVRAFSAHALVECLGEQAEQSVPALAKQLSQEKVGEVRLAIIQELAALGPKAQAAIPVLEEARRDVQLAVREAARQALKKIQ